MAVQLTAGSLGEMLAQLYRVWKPRQHLVMDYETAARLERMGCATWKPGPRFRGRPLDGVEFSWTTFGWLLAARSRWELGL
jgi:hypothetical protein